jgi:hypothetical protein
MVELVLTPEALFWFKIAGWLFIGGCATWALGSIWADNEKENNWRDALRKSEQDKSERHQQ